MSQLNEQLKSEPALAWKLAVNVPGKGDDSPEASRARAEVRDAPLVRSLIATCDRQSSAYKKWDGAHWVLSILGDLGYPAGDETLRPLMEHTFNTWLSKAHEKHIRMINGRIRRCASQEGNAVWSSLRLGLADGRTDELVSRLLQWQWPDGGWNCDKRPEADTSSFMETLIPLRALALYAQVSGDSKVKTAAERAAEVFLSRRLFKRQQDGSVMDKHFVRLSYPPYWHYNILFGLKVMAEAGFISDPRCKEALDLLESRRLPDGGFPAEESYTQASRPSLSGYSPIRWGGTSRKTANLFVTVDALYVLRIAGRV
ncbi:MAG: hypothetical protein NTV38_06280 [Chloroflexi bacterium]|nr:hypothetical protein [Chloroflexota bacterium]